MEPAPLSPARVRVPASTSNLGPGFDFLGLCLELFLEVRREDVDGTTHEVVRAEDEAAHWPLENNLLCRAFDTSLRTAGLAPRPSRFKVRSEIPLGRGLGSSGAAVAAGLCLGLQAAGHDIPQADSRELTCLAELGLALEGHPDNSSASLVGGCTLAVPVGAGRLRIVRQPLAQNLIFGVAWTSEQLATDAARAALPGEVPFAVAVENPRRLALLLEGLRLGQDDLIALGIEDRLHVEARLALIPGGRAALDAAREAGAAGATVSGSGSALVAVATDAEVARHAAAAMAEELGHHADWTTERVLKPAREGATPVGDLKG
ncbi:MAG: homoserine kinase [bacterium]|jgi:homoserine kinase|nr:homoserine kinase [Planctomycetota bacterium]HIL52663.1 homoserine kinase [Planctomycetota bacterium]